MGWASGGDIFDPVAQGLIDAGASDDIKRQVLGTLIDKLQDGDWDTEDESMREFADDPIIAAEFVKRGVGADLDGGTLGVTDDGTAWTLTCDERPRCGQIDTPPLTIAGHDELVRVWFGHQRELHEGDGQVGGWMLLGEAAA